MGLFDGVNKNLAYNNVVKKLSGTAIAANGSVSLSHEALIKTLVDKTNGKSNKIRAALDVLIQGGLITASNASATLNFETLMSVSLPSIARNQELALEDIVRVARILVIMDTSGLLTATEGAGANRAIIARYEGLSRAQLLLNKLGELKTAGLLSASNPHAQSYMALAFVTPDTTVTENITRFLVANKDNGKSAAIATLSALGHAEDLLASFEKWPALASIFSSLQLSGLFADGNEHAQADLTTLIATSADKLQEITVICERLKSTSVFSSTNPETRNNFIRLFETTTDTSALVASLENPSIIELLSNADSSQSCFETILSPDENRTNLTTLLNENRASAGSILSVYINLKVKGFFAENSAERFELFRNAVTNIAAINTIFRKLDGSWILNPANPNAVTNITTILQNHAVLASLNNIIDGGALPVLLDPTVRSEQQQACFNGLFANTHKFSDIENIVTVMQGRSIFAEPESVEIARVFIDTVTTPAYDTANVLVVIRLLNATLVFTDERAKDNFRAVLQSGAVPEVLLGYLQAEHVQTLLSDQRVAQCYFDLLVNSGEVAVILAGVLAANSDDIENIINLYTRLEALGYFQGADFETRFELFQGAVSRAEQINQLLTSFAQSNLIGHGIPNTLENISVILRIPASGFAVLEQLRFATSTEATKYLGLLPKSEEQLGYLNTVLSNLPANLATDSGLRVVERRPNMELLAPVFVDAEINTLLTNPELGKGVFDLLLESDTHIQQTATILTANTADLPVVLNIYKDFVGCGIDKINTLLTDEAKLHDLFRLISVPPVQALLRESDKNEIIGLLTNAVDNWGNLHQLLVYLLDNTDLSTPDNAIKILKAHNLSANIHTVMRNYKGAPIFAKGSPFERANKAFQVILQMDDRLKTLSDAQAELAGIDRLNKHNINILAAAVNNGWDVPAVVKVFTELPLRDDGHTDVTYVFSILGLTEYTQEEFFALAAVIIDKNSGEKLIPLLHSLKEQGLITADTAKQVFRILLAYNETDYRDLSRKLNQFVEHIKPLEEKFGMDADLMSFKIKALMIMAKSGPKLSLMVTKFLREISAESMESFKSVDGILDSLYNYYKSFYRDQFASLGVGSQRARDAIALADGSDAGFPTGLGSVKSGMHFTHARSSVGGSHASIGTRVSYHGSTITTSIDGLVVSEAEFFIRKTCEEDIAGKLLGLSSLRKTPLVRADDLCDMDVAPGPEFTVAGLH